MDALTSAMSSTVMNIEKLCRCTSLIFAKKQSSPQDASIFMDDLGQYKAQTAAWEHGSYLLLKRGFVGVYFDPKTLVSSWKARRFSVA